MTRPKLPFARSAGAPPRPPSIGQSVVVSVLLVVAVLALVWAVGNPLLAAGAGVVAVGLGYGLRDLRHRLRRRDGRTIQICLPRADVCVEV